MSCIAEGAGESCREIKEPDVIVAFKWWHGRDSQVHIGGAMKLAMKLVGEGSPLSEGLKLKVSGHRVIACR